MPVSDRALTAADIVNQRVSKIEPADEEMEDTHSMARIQSAIPPTPEDGYHDDAAMERFPRWRVILLAAVASVLVVGGGALAIFRPWDPDAYVTHATEDADTSMEGFPGFVQSLSGQDKKANAGSSAGEVVTPADMVTESYQRLGALSEQADENAALLSTYLGGDGSGGWELGRRSRRLQRDDPGQLPAQPHGCHPERLDQRLPGGPGHLRRVEAAV